MKQAREYPQVKVSKKAEHAIIKGHPWVYFNEITGAQPFENGELVDVVSQKGSYLGTGFANENSKIRVRLISRNANDKFDEAFFETPGLIGVHPNDNRTTIFLKINDLINILKAHGNKVVIYNFK